MTEITVYFSTNRMPFKTNKAKYASGIAFGADLSVYEGRSLRFGRAIVEVPAGGKGTVREVVVAEENLTPNKANASPLFGSRLIFDSVRKSVAEGDGDVLFTLHGYANDFEGGLAGAAEIAERVGRSSVFAFCWPSQDLAIGVNYGAAREKARISGEAIGRAYRILLRFLDELAKQDQQCDRKVDLIAHSMGNYALRHAIQAMKKDLEDGSATRLIDDLVLVAADDDNDTLELATKMAPILPFARTVTVYHSRKDIVLQWSDRVKFNPDRLGQTGPRNMNATADNVVAVDVTEIIEDPVDGFLDHWYHRETPRVIVDIKATLDYKGIDPGEIPGRVPIPTARRRYLMKR